MSTHTTSAVDTPNSTVLDAPPLTADRPAWQRVLAAVLPLALFTIGLPRATVALVGREYEERVWYTVSLLHSLAAVAAGIAVVLAARSMTGRRRVAWLLISAGAGAWGASNLLWSVENATDRLVNLGFTGPTWMPTFTAANSLLLLGVMALPSSPTRVARLRRLDTAIMVTAATALLWVLPVTSMLQKGSTNGASPTFVVLAAVKVLSVLVAMGAFARCRPDTHNEIRPLAFSIIVLAVADLLFASNDTEAQPWGSPVANALYTAAIALLIVAARRQSGPPRTEPGPASEAPTRRSRLAMPELATVVALVALALHGQFDETEVWVSVGLGATLVALAIVRLGQLEHEQRQLVASLQRSARQLFEDARIDALTGLGNRLSLDERLDRAVGRVGGGTAGAITVFFVDVDHFKRFNDGLGHHVGDQILVEVSSRLREVLGRDSVHRVGGDEFVAVCEGLDRAAAQQYGEDAVSVVRSPILIDGHELNCTVSVGIAHLERPDPDGLGKRPGPAAEQRPSHHPTAQEVISADLLLRRADLALYAAKEQGRNGWAAYDPRLQQQADHRIEMQQGVHVALERNEIEVHYRPVVELATGQMVGLAATPTWRSPRHGLLEPSRFRQSVIDGGMLPELGARLFDDIGSTLFDVAAGWASIRWIAAPLSREEIVLPGLVDRVLRAVGEAGVDGSRLRIEVSEDTVLDDAALSVIHELRRHGIHLTVHRFGTGASSLLGLGQYPASTITIDPSFVEGLGRRRDDTVIVTAIGGLTADLGLEFAADGITEPFQAQMLLDIGCSLGAGRLYGDAAPRWDLPIATTAAR